MRKFLFQLGLIVGLAFLGGVSLEAETIFETSFDESPPYQEGARLPTTPDALGGKWYSDQVAGLPIVVSGEKPLTAPHSLLLENTGEGFEPGQKATAWRSVGLENAAGAQTAKTITLSVAFTLSRVDGHEAEFAAVGLPTQGGNVSFSVRIGMGGAVTVGRGSAESEVLAAIEAGTWYELEIITPLSEGPEVHPVINLYSVKGTERGERLATFDGLALPPKTTRGSFVFFNSLPHSKIFFDNFRVTLED